MNLLEPTPISIAPWEVIPGIPESPPPTTYRQIPPKICRLIEDLRASLLHLHRMWMRAQQLPDNHPDRQFLKMIMRTIADDQRRLLADLRTAGAVLDRDLQVAVGELMDGELRSLLLRAA